jgi:hypothetical protein
MAIFAVAGGAFVGSNLDRGSSLADKLPGALAQQSEDVDNGVTVRVVEATFSGAGAELVLQVDSSAPAAKVFWPKPASSYLAEAQGDAVHVSSDGRSVLTFQGVLQENWGSQLTLTIGEVQTYSDRGEVETVAGRWTLVVDTPVGKDAANATKNVALVPTRVDVGSQSFVLRGSKVPGATVIRYDLPTSVVSTGEVSVDVAGQKLRLKRAATFSSTSELWFEEAGPGPLRVNFESLLVMSPEADAPAVSLQLQPIDAASRTIDGSGSTLFEPTWSSDGNVGVKWVRVIRDEFDRTSLLVRLDGAFNPHLNGKPIVIGDGKLLWVSGVTNYNPTEQRGAETQIELPLALDLIPTILTLDLQGRAETKSNVQAILTR